MGLPVGGGLKQSACFDADGNSMPDPAEKAFRHPVAYAPALNYSPRGDRVIVKRLPQEQPKEGEVIIPGSQRGLLNEGIVIAVGPAKELADLQVGQHVCFLDFAGTTIEIDGEEYLSMREQEIHGVRKA